MNNDDYIRAATLLNCEPAAIKAVVAVESAGGGYNADGSIKILFEGHWFHRYTKGKFAQSDPDLCYPKWTTKFYGKNYVEENARLARAEKLDQHAAWLSSSWGLFQIMGFNHTLVGFKTVEEYVTAVKSSETAQLEAFCRYVQHSGLADELRDRRWADFARLYNGPEYKKNRYDEKLATAYARFAKE